MTTIASVLPVSVSYTPASSFSPPPAPQDDTVSATSSDTATSASSGTQAAAAPSSDTPDNSSNSGAYNAVAQANASTIRGVSVNTSA